MDVNAFERKRGPKKTKAQSNFKWKDSKPVCHKCHEVGHIGRECKALKEKPKDKVGKGPKKSSEDKTASDSEN